MQHTSRYLIGIDLGTTNSVLAYIDTEEALAGREDIHLLDIPQLVGPGEARSLTSLPSFLYFPSEEEIESNAFRLPWDNQPRLVAGAVARDHGSLVPTRQVVSAKSWLSNANADRRANILPRDATPPLISPVDASAQYLRHLRAAWDHSFAHHANAAFEEQEVYLTVPASFDEEARELTIEAAQRAGLSNFVLLEEPLAAFYAWTAARGVALRDELRDGDVVLICDIGGGTSDFSLMRARIGGEGVQFERKAVGEHLLLGGDNLDLALTHIVQAKLGGAQLNIRQRHALQRACGAAKERLLSDSSIDRLPITVLGSGRQVVGQAVITELLRGEVENVLTHGFVPSTAADDLPKRARSTALREIGLAYVGDPAITKHIAAFLRQSAKTVSNNSPDARVPMARPDVILFNGGFCQPEIVRQRIVDVITEWFSTSQQRWLPRVLKDVSLGSAVAQGAAHYGRVRRGQGVRVQAGNARAYYIGLPSEKELRAICILPSGVQEGTALPLRNRDFAVRANRPVSFTLYSSRTRSDPHEAVVVLDPDQVHRHAPLVALLRYGKKLRDVELSVRLSVTFTELGTLELWCESTSSPHRWRLQFELRAAETELHDQAAPPRKAPAMVSSVGAPFPPGDIEDAVRLVQNVFVRATSESTPDALASSLESALNAKRDAWPATVIRRFADVLLNAAEGRKKSPRHEVRWLNLVGFCMRPGFGVMEDNRRIRQLRNFLSGPIFPRDSQCEAEFLVLLRRVCGGFNAAQQHEMYRRYWGILKASSGKKSVRINPQVEYDCWRLLAGLEYLPVTIRASLGNEVLTHVKKLPADRRWYWPLARLGTRIPLYGPLTSVIAPDAVSSWITTLEGIETLAEAASALSQLARRTDDPGRDIPDNVRRRVVRSLKEAGVEPELIRPVQDFMAPERADAVRLFGDSLPRDLQLISSKNCFLSLAALTGVDDQAVS